MHFFGQFVHREKPKKVSVHGLKRKIKNEKMYRWRLEFSCYSFVIVFCPGKGNIFAETCSRVYCLGDTLIITVHFNIIHCVILGL